MPIGYADGVRRGADERLRRARRRAARAARRHRVDGQRHARPGRRPAAARQRRRAARPPGRGARAGGGVGAPAGHDQLRDHVRDQRARAARAPPRRGAGGDEPSRPRRGAQAARRARGVDRRRRRARPAAGPRHGRPRPRRCPRTRRSRPAPSRARPAAPPSACPARSARGAWSGRGHSWHVDLVRLRDGDIDADLAARDFTINAMAEPLAGGELLDPHGGRADLEARRLLRMVGPSSLADDPLRTLRAVRLAVDLELVIDPDTAAEIGRRAPGLERVAPERVFGELKQVVCAPAARTGLAPDGGARHHRPGPARAARPARGGAERLPPPRRPRPHAGRARPGGGDRARPGRRRASASTPGRSPRCCASRSPTSSRAGRRCASPRSCTTRPSPGRAGRGPAGGPASPATTARAPRSRAGCCAACAPPQRLVRLRRRAVPAPPARGVPRPRAAARPPRRVALPQGDRAVVRRGDGVHGGRPAGHARPQRRAGHRRRTSRSRASCSATRSPPRERGPPLVRGDELARELGVPPGPGLGDLLAQLEEDRFAGEIATREDALRRARELAARRLTSFPRSTEVSTVTAMASPDCLFCKIVAGEIPSTRVREDERTVAFMDINPATRGHLLVVPRAHAVDLLEVPAEDLAACAAAAQELAARQQRAARRRRREPPELVRRGRVADRLPLPRARHPALRRTTRCGCRGGPRRATRTPSRRRATALTD